MMETRSIYVAEGDQAEAVWEQGGSANDTGPRHQTRRQLRGLHAALELAPRADWRESPARGLKVDVKPDRWQRLKDLFDEASGLDGPERERYLDGACADDRELRAELDSLLAAGQESGRFLETPAAEVLQPDLQGSVPSHMGRRFGPYRVLAEIGRGGMGVVYRALRDDDAFHKEVALKLLPDGLESSYFEERFRRERQILASLEHPNIARLIDGGADEVGRPYLVMELVEGVPIDVYCRERSLGLLARLELVRNACSAVALAHSQLVVHCDLKPANVLVTADGTVKLLDFGIARLLAPDPRDPVATATVTGWWMTPEYASPEQVRGEPVTAATDVYALGVLLYELLTGRKPYDLGSRAPEEIVRAICEQAVTRPSQVVMRPLPGGPADSAEITSVAATRSLAASASSAGVPDSNLRRLRRRLEGDLDVILMRALAKEPTRRYTSVVELSEDLRRYLVGLPIRARPDRLGYRARKFFGRHRMSVAAAVLVLVSLCGGLTLALQQAHVARTERAVAERRFEEVRDLARTFIFEIHDAVAALPGSTPVRKRIVELGLEYLERLENEAADDAGLRAELAEAYERIAEVQGGVGVANLGDTKGAIESQQRALVLREAMVRASPADLGAQLSLARAYSTLGDLFGAVGDREGRLLQYDAALAIRSAAAEREPDDVAVRRAVASSLWDTSQLHVDDGDLQAGLAGFEETLEQYRIIAEAPGTGDGDRRNLALTLKKVGAVRSVSVDLDGALAALEAALAIDLDRLATSPGRTETLLDVSFDHSDLGYVLLRLGRSGEAVEHYEQAVALRRTVSDADPEDVRARNVLRSARLRLAAALAAVVGGDENCAEVRPHADRAVAVWADVEAESPLDSEAEGARLEVLRKLSSCRPP